MCEYSILVLPSVDGQQDAAQHKLGEVGIRPASITDAGSGSFPKSIQQPHKRQRL